MQNYLNGFGLTCATLVLSACHHPNEIEYVTPNVPAQMRQPVEVPARKADTLADVGLILTDHVEALHTANGRITSIDCILTAAETGQESTCLDEPHLHDE